MSENEILQDVPETRDGARPAPINRILAGLDGGIRRAVDFLLPPHCPVCRRAVATGGGLCSTCWSSMEFICEPYCQVYGTPFAYYMGEDIVSAQAIADPPPFEAARAAVKYGTAAKALVHGLKYRDRFETVEPMLTAMARAGAVLLDRCELIVPVPLHRWRLISRRFNQSMLLANGLSRLCNRPSGPFVPGAPATDTPTGGSFSQSAGPECAGRIRRARTAPWHSRGQAGAVGRRRLYIRGNRKGGEPRPFARRGRRCRRPHLCKCLPVGTGHSCVAIWRFVNTFLYDGILLYAPCQD